MAISTRPGHPSAAHSDHYVISPGHPRIDGEVIHDHGHYEVVTKAAA